MDGVVVLLKPPGMTSSNAVYDVRRIFSEKRAGHLGTLDPGAAGVLPVCLGRATRLFDLLVDKDKEYVFEVAFGAATDTQDAYGRVLARSSQVVTAETLEAVLPEFLGEQRQTAPVYSALKVDGRKMCDLVREGKAVEARERRISISRLTLLEQTGPNRFLLKMGCSRGTYVRTVCEDLGRRLNACAYMSLLIRTASGPFTLAQSRTVAELTALSGQGGLAQAVVSCQEALMSFPAVTLMPERRTPTMNGLETHMPDLPTGNVRLYCDGFLGVGRVENGSVKLTVHLYDTHGD